MGRLYPQRGLISLFNLGVALCTHLDAEKFKGAFDRREGDRGTVDLSGAGMQDLFQTFLKIERIAVEHLLVCIFLAMTDQAIIESGERQHRRGGGFSALHSLDVVAGRAVAYLALDTIFWPERGIELPGLRIRGSSVAAQADGALSGFHIHTGDFGNFERLGNAQHGMGFGVLRESPQAALIAPFLTSVARNARADAHVEGGSRPFRRPRVERESQAKG